MAKGKPFAQWCSEWRDEYARAVAARGDAARGAGREAGDARPEQVKTVRTALAEATARLQQHQREQQARSSYHVKFPNAKRDVTGDYHRQRVIEALAKRLGVPAVDEADLGPAAAAIAGRGTVEVRAQRFLADVEFQSVAEDLGPLRRFNLPSRAEPTSVKPKAPVVLKLAVRVSSAPGALSATTATTNTSATTAPAAVDDWEGTHLFVAVATPPEQDTMSSIDSLGNRMDAALWEDALKKLDAAEETRPERWTLLEARLATAGAQAEQEPGTQAGRGDRAPDP